MLRDTGTRQHIARIVALASAFALLLFAYDARPLGPPADAVTIRAAAQNRPEGAELAAEAVVPVAAPAGPAAPPHVELTTIAPVPPNPLPWASAPSLRQGAPPPPQTGALSAIVLDEASGAALYEADAHRELAVASLTKIATAIVALRYGGLDEEVTSDVDGFMMRGSTTMGLYSGDRINRRDLLYGLMLPSGNDAALVLGRSIAGTDDAFVGQMNALVRELGLRHTYFATPHGLGRAGYSSAHDMAMLSRHAMQIPEFATIVQTENWKVTGSRQYMVHNVNSFIFNYPGADGVKTGYTNSAGRTLVASATRDGHRLYAVILNDQTMYSDAYALLDWAFANHAWDTQAVATAATANGMGTP